MGKMLNFSESEKNAVKEFLSKFPRKPTKTKYEEMRVEIDGAIVTLYSSGKVVVQGENSEKAKQLILRKMKAGKEEELIFGIDETGRGERFGPFVVAGVLGRNSELRELRDSKKTRDLAGKAKIVAEKCIFALIEEVPSHEIDRARNQGLTMNEIEVKIINNMADFCLKKHQEAKIKVDGARLKGASPEVEFIVKGDDKVPVIGAASVLARHARDISEDKEIRKSWKN